MPVYLFTFRAYRSWNADNPRGYVRWQEGVLPPDREMAARYDKRALAAPNRFDKFQQAVLVWIAYDACQRRNWRLHYVATERTHVHILVSWREFQPWEKVCHKLKNLASLMLGRKCATPGHDWFGGKRSRKRVKCQRHFDHLVNNYLPKHRGLQWREGQPPPQEPTARTE